MHAQMTASLNRNWRGDPGEGKPYGHPVEDIPTPSPLCTTVCKCGLEHSKAKESHCLLTLAMYTIVAGKEGDFNPFLLCQDPNENGFFEAAICIEKKTHMP